MNEKETLIERKGNKGRSRKEERRGDDLFGGCEE